MRARILVEKIGRQRRGQKAKIQRKDSNSSVLFEKKRGRACRYVF